MSFGYTDLQQAINFIESIKKKITRLSVNIILDNVRGKINIELIGPRDLQQLAMMAIKDLYKEFLEK